MRKFTEKEFNKVGHTLGINIYHSLRSKQKRDKILPVEFYRNYYNYGRVSENHKEPDWINGLSEFIEKWETSGLYYFCINDKGIEQFRKQFKEEITDKYVPLSRKKQRYQDYLECDTCDSFAEF